MDFTNKKVLITGGSRGIGKATAIAFARQGAEVAINFQKNSRAAKETIDLLAGEGHFAIKADIGDPVAVQKLTEAVIAEFGNIDIVVNNAGIYDRHPIISTSYEAWQTSWQQTLGINLFGAANVCYCVAHNMIKNGGGHIINVSSRGAFRGEPEHTAYGASKGGLNVLSQSLAKELGEYGISVTAVAPGFVETDMAADILDSELGKEIKAQSPFGRVASPEEVAETILFLASEKAVFLSGGIVDVNGASYLRA